MGGVIGDAVAWLSALLFPSTGVVGWLLRRRRSGAIAMRLRPHFILGYAVLALAVAHVAFAMNRMGVLSATNAWIATFALLGLGLQTFIGLSLQAPGAYRLTLRRWHLATMATVAVLITGHVLLTR
jgi:uncharacterized membrane protein YadS